jgi:hypothetical protein
MKRILLVLCGLLLMPALVQAEMKAKEIAFARPCAQGVPTYDATKDAINCATPKMGGSGYVIEMATNADGSATCPGGFHYIGHISGSGTQAGLQRFACAKN